MGMASGLAIFGGWQCDYFSVAQSGLFGIGPGLDYSNSNIIAPFIEAYNERAKTIYNSDPNNRGWTDCNNPSSGYPLLSNLTDFPDSESPIPSRPFYSFYDSAPSSGIFFYGSGYYPTSGTADLHSKIAISGISWPQLQYKICNLASYFVNAYQGSGHINYDGVSAYCPSGNYDTGTIDLFIPAIIDIASGYITQSNSVSGIFSVISSANPWAYDRILVSGVTASTFKTPNVLALGLREGNTNDYQPNNRYTFVNFPSPSGFTRKFPREIWSTSCSGSNGQISRLTSRNTHIGSYSATPNTWYGDYPWASGFSNSQFTPVQEYNNSGKIYQYYAASGGWVFGNQGLSPDILTAYGQILEGDYMGPWILNDLRDALNQMVWTVAINYDTENLVNETESVFNFINPNFKFSLSPQFLPIAFNMDTSFGVSGTFFDLTNTPQKNILVSGIGTHFIGSGNGILPYAYRNAFVDKPGVGNNTFAQRAYCYLKPFQVNQACSGMSRTYDFYNTTRYLRTFDSDYSYISGTTFNPSPSQFQYTYNNYGDIGQYDFYPNISGLPVYSGTSYIKYIGSITANRDGTDIGILAGDSSLSCPGGPIDQSSGPDLSSNCGGYSTSSIICVAKWDVANGFNYTKFTPASGV